MTWDSDDDPYAEEEYLEGEEEDPEPEDESESAPNEHESGSATSGSPTPEPVATSLDESIKTAPVEQIRSLLTFICQKHESARKLASGRLLAPLDSDTGRKRKAFEKCKNCDEEYNVTTNYKGDCVYHPGEKEIYEDGDFWADHDENCHGRIWDFRDDPNHEEGFSWTCCDKLGGEDGCVVSRHKPDVREALAKKVRY